MWFGMSVYDTIDDICRQQIKTRRFVWNKGSKPHIEIGIFAVDREGEDVDVDEEDDDDDDSGAEVGEGTCPDTDNIVRMTSFQDETWK